MARARNIKPSFFQNDELGELDPLARLAFIGMWTIADFKGCIEYRPKMLKVQLLPYDECDIELITNNLDKARFIRFYSVQGKRYIKIVNFEKHQNPHKNERDSGSLIPDITEQDKESNNNNELAQDGTKPDLIGTARADSLLLIPSTLIPDSSLPTATSADKKNPKPKLISPLDTLVDLGAEEQAASDWLRVRKAKRAPFTQTVLDDLKREAGKAGISVGQAVAICARKSWQGFNASWNWSDAKPVSKGFSGVQDARLEVARQIMGDSQNGNDRSFIDITETGAIESSGARIPEIADGIWEPAYVEMAGD